MEETLLMLDEPCPVLGNGFSCAHRLLASSRVPDHREKHRAHQRNFGELPRYLRTVTHVLQDQDGSRCTDTDENDRGRQTPPDTKAVEQGEADPDEVERDRL